jgi:hypothetical protein
LLGHVNWKFGKSGSATLLFVSMTAKAAALNAS